MNLKTRLALLYSLSVFFILLASAISIYILNENFRKQEFVKRLVNDASETFQILINLPDQSTEALKTISDHAIGSLPNEKIFIYDSNQKLIYASPGATSPGLFPEYFSLATDKEYYTYDFLESENVLLHRIHNDKSYYILAGGRDVFGVRKSDNLKILLASSIIGGLLLSGLLAFFYVGHTMKPLEELKMQIERINEKNLRDRIFVGTKNNEIWQIAKRFNDMLDRLEQAFEQRKTFVQNASHELRTPLANMLAQTESALNKNLTPEEYQHILRSIKEDQQYLIDLTNSLLILSRYEKIASVQDWSPVRLDEVLYDTVEFAGQIWSGAVVSIEFDTVPEDEKLLIYKSNEPLIKSAVQNLVKNAIQYSDDCRVKIGISATKSGITLRFDNSGKQLSAEEQSRLFIPFFRGENSQYKKGFGLGLSIIQRIITVHAGTITYEAIGKNINRFTIFFPASNA